MMWILVKGHLESIPYVHTHYTKIHLKYFTNSAVTVESIFVEFKKFYKYTVGYQRSVDLLHITFFSSGVSIEYSNTCPV